MSFVFHCPNGHPFSVQEAIASKQVHCRVCHVVFDVPVPIRDSFPDDEEQSPPVDLELPASVELSTASAVPVFVARSPFVDLVRQVLFEPLFIASFAGGVLLVSLVFGIAWRLTRYETVIPATEVVATVQENPAPAPASSELAPLSSPIAHPAASNDSLAQDASPGFDSKPSAQFPADDAAPDMLRFHPVGVAVSSDGKTAFVWGGAKKDLYNFQAACGPPYQFAVLDIESRTLTRSSTTASPILTAAIDDKKIYAVMVNPAEYGARDHSVKEVSIVKFNKRTLDPEAFKNVKTLGETVEIVAAKYVVIDGSHRFQLPDLQALPNDAKVESHRYGQGWIWENAVWNPMLDTPRLLLSVNRNQWPVAMLHNLASHRSVPGTQLQTPVALIDHRLEWSQVSPESKEREFEFRIEPAQSSFTLSALEPTKVHYSTNAPATFTLELRARSRNAEPFFHAESSNGSFELQLANRGEGLLPTPVETLISKGAALLSTQAFVDYLSTAVSEYRQYTGQSPQGIPTAVLATVKATSKTGEVAILEHQFLVDLPNENLRLALMSGRALSDMERLDNDASKKVATKAREVPKAKPSTDVPAPSTDVPAAEDIAFDPSKPELAIDKFSRVRFVFESGVQEALYLPPGRPENGGKPIRAKFSPGRGFPLRPADPGMSITKLTLTDIERKVVTNRERLEGCERLTLKDFGGLAEPADFRSRSVLWSKDGNAAYLLNTKNQLFRVNLNNWQVDAAIQLPDYSQIQSCQQGIVVLSRKFPQGSSHSKWIDMGGDSQSRKQLPNALFLLDETSLAVQASTQTSADAIAGHQESPILLLNELQVAQTTAINTKHWELIGSLDMQMPMRVRFSEHMAAKGFVCLRGTRSDELQIVRERMSTLIQKWYKQNDTLTSWEGKLAYSEDGSRAIFYRSDVQNILQSDIDDIPSIDHPVFEGSSAPLSLGMNTETKTFYAAVRWGMYVDSPLVVRILNATGEARVAFDVSPNTSDEIAIRVASNGKGAFVRKATGFYWLEPSLSSIKSAQDGHSAKESTTDSDRSSVKDNGNKSLPSYEIFVPVSVSALKGASHERF